MSASLKPLTVEGFLGWERAQPLRYEFDGIQPIAMTGGSRRHARVQTDLVIALGTLVKPPCQVFGSGLKVITRHRVRYPDASVVRGPDLSNADDVEPTAVFEALSPSTALTDRRVKPFDYASVPSVQVYVLLDPETAEATVMRRDRGWDPETFTAGAGIPLPDIDVTLPLAAIFPR
jgi:Uma2 family endonuclease